MHSVNQAVGQLIKQSVQKTTTFFAVDTSQAGKAELGVAIHSPSRMSITPEIVDTPRGKSCTYMPVEPGPHLIYITYGGLDVPGKNLKIY